MRVSGRALAGAVLALMAMTRPAAAQQAAPIPLSVMTYNVEGLPWPARTGRGADLDAIAARLTAMRASGTQPDVVVLQETFSPAARDIARRAGYRYTATGPDAATPGAPAATPAEQAFVARGSVFTGEGIGKWASSGLMIASDFPIVAVRRMAYPDYACAGFDCLANKGVLLVDLRVPGSRTLITLVATHLNSCGASRVKYARSLAAYQAQVDALDGFLARNLDPERPVIVAGDFNVGHRPERRDYLLDRAVNWGSGQPVQAALYSCRGPCRVADAHDIGFTRGRGRDWQFYGSSPHEHLRLTGLSAPFGHRADGSMLSDHVGYIANYELTPIAETRVVLAAR